jgi:signal transduction histidine kinase
MLNSIPFLHRLDSRLEQIRALHLKDDPNAHFNKYFILGNLLVMPLMFLLALQALALHISVLLIYSLGLLTYYLFNLLVFRRFFKPQKLIFVQKTVTLIATVIFVYLMGGIMHSGGLILVGIAAVTHTIIFHNYRWMVFEFTLFLAGVAIISLLPNPYAADPPLNEELNTTMFTMTLVGITAYVFILALYAVNLYSQMEKKETVRQKEMSEAKSRLYTNITHEFRTPLTVILGLAEALKAGKASDLHSACDTITRNGNNLLRLVQQLIDLNRLEDGKFEVKYTHGDIIPFIKYLFQLQLPMAKEKNISYDMSSEHPSYLLDFDPDKISTIVSNLLSNAIKFTPTGGKVELNLSATKKELHIAVMDTGVGIPVDKMDKIFDRFYMVNDKSTRQFGGAGIGLSLTKELVVLLQGEISVSSEPDVQTTFTM